MTDANPEYSLGGFGARLKTAREALNLTQKDAALRLHLNPNILEILETENFQKAPPATFMRGYLRSYARLLNFNEDDINTALTQSGLESQTRSLVIPTMREEITPMSDHHVQRISTFVVLGLFIFVGIWWGFHSSSNNNMLTRTNQLAAPPVPKQPPVTQPAPPPTQPVVTATTTTPGTVVPAAAPVQPAAPITQQQTAATTTPAPAVPMATAASPVAVSPAAPPAAPIAGTTPNTTMPNVVNATGTTDTTAPTVTPAPPVTATATPAATPQITIPLRAPNTTVASSDNSDTPKKRNRHHRQTGTVSGFSMALPEPGL